MSSLYGAVHTSKKSAVSPFHFPDLVLGCGGCRDYLLEKHHSSVRDNCDINTASESSLKGNDDCLTGNIWSYNFDRTLGGFQDTKEKGIEWC